MYEGLPVNIETRQVGHEKDHMIYYPKVSGMKNSNFERTINHKIVEQTQDLIDLQAGEMPTQIESMIGLFEIKNNQRQVLSLSIFNYTYHHHAAHGMTYIKPLTFDLKKEKQCSLKDLFKPGSNYIQRLSNIIQQQIKERNIITLNGFTSIKPDQDFYIADKSLVIYFQLYEITAYVFGFPMFPISVYEIMDIIDENGPLGRMAIND